jgi:hypothetical protein
MSEGRARDEWMRCGAVMALMANINRDRKQHPQAFQPKDFMPAWLARREVREKPAFRVNVRELKGLFVKGG